MESKNSQFVNLIDLIQFTELITTKIHGVFDKEEILSIVETEFRKTEKYQILLLLLSDKGNDFYIKSLTLPGEKIKIVEKIIGRNIKNIRFNSDNTPILKRVIEKGDTYYCKSIELANQILPESMVSIVAKITGHDKKYTIVSPLIIQNKTIGIFAIDSPELIDYFILSVKNLARNISVAFELAEENDRRKIMEDELKHSETKFRTLYESTSDAVMLLNEKGFFDCNFATLKIFGCATKDEFCSKHPADLSPPIQDCGTDSITLANERIATALKNGRNKFDWVHKRADTGEIFPADVLLSRMELDGNMVLQATVRDITDRKKAEEELQLMNAELEYDIEKRIETEISLQKSEEEILKLNNELEIKIEKRTEQLAETNKNLIHEIEKHKRTENLLIKSNERYEYLIKTSLDGFWIVDTNGHFLEVNDEYCAMTGYSRDQLLKMQISNIEAKETEEITTEHINLVVTQGWDRFETKHRCANGKIIDVEISVVFISSQKIMLVFIHNITQRKLAEIIRRKSEEKFRLLFDIIPDAIFIHDFGGRILQVNKVAPLSLGYNDEELLQMTIQDINVPEIAVKIPENLIELIEKGQLIIESAHVRKNGTVIPIEICCCMIEYADNPAVLAIVRDISERKQAEEKLKQSEISLKDAQHIAKMGSWEFDTTNRKVYWSENYFKIFNLLPAEITPSFEYFKSMVHADDLHLIDEGNERVMSRKSEVKIEFRIVFPDGTVKWIENTTSPIFKDDILIKLKGVFIDITDRKKIEEELIKSNEKLTELNLTKDKFFSIIAHDLKNPFAGLLSSCELLKRNIAKQDMCKIEKNTESIYTSSKKAYNILEDLLNWARLQMGKFKVKKEKFNIHSIISDVIEVFKNVDTSKEIEILIKGNEKAEGFFDIDMFKLLIRNITANAIKFSNNRDKVILEISDFNDQQYIISVKDSGVGIIEDDLKKLFRIDISHTTAGTNDEKGTGLGLILCKEFAEKNNSEIFVESEEGKGSTFSFTVEKYIA